MAEIIRMTGRGLRGMSWGDSARLIGAMGDITVPSTATDAEVLAIPLNAFAQIVAAAPYTVIPEVKVAAAVNINLANPGTAVFDGYTVSNGDGIFIGPAQTTGSQRGVYVFNGSGVAMTRRADFDDSAEVVTGSYVRIMNGDTMAGAFVLVTTGTITVGTTAQVWNRFDIDALAMLRRPGGAGLVVNRLLAGSNLRDQTLAERVNDGVLQPSQFAGATDEDQFVAAIAEASRVLAGPIQGQTVEIPRGELVVTETFNLANRASVIGLNKRGSIIKADAAFVGDYMATAENGGSSMFDNALERLTLNCNDVADLGGILSSAWQEGGGLRNVLVQKFLGIGVHFQDGDGGASTCLIDQCEIFGSGAGSGAVAGIKVDQISAVGNFMLRVTNSTITGDNGVPMARGIDVENDSLHCEVVHFEECETGIYLDGVGHHVLVGCTGAQTGGGAPTVENLVEIAATFTGTLEMIGCFRGGALNFLKDNRTGGFGTITGYDPARFFIHGEPVLGALAMVAGGNFDGSGATGAKATTNCRGVSGINKDATGTYTITLSRGGASANDFFGWCNGNVTDGRERVELLGVNTQKLYIYDTSGALTDSSQIHFGIYRVT